MEKLSEQELCLRKVHVHLLADPPRIVEAMVAIQYYGEQLGMSIELLEFAQDTPLCDERLRLSQRQINALEEHEILFLGQLLAQSRAFLESIPYFESDDLFRKLERHKLTLGALLSRTSAPLCRKAQYWSCTVPSKEGWYWVRKVDDDDEDPIIMHLVEAQLLLMSRSAYSFYGPIQQPSI